MNKQSYQFIFYYTNKFVLGYNDQIEQYLLDSMFDKLKIKRRGKKLEENIFENYVLNMPIYLSSNMCIIDHVVNDINVSINKQKITRNPLDMLKLDKIGNFLSFGSFNENCDMFVNKMSSYGSVYVFDFNIPKYTINDLNKFKSHYNIDYNYLYRDLDMFEFEITLDEVNDIEHFETMSIGKIIFLIHPSKTIKNFVTCEGYDNLLIELDRLTD